MPNLELAIVILAATVPLVALAQRIKVAYPIVLILGGVAVGYLPGMPRIELPPELVLVLFLPGLVYWESVTAPAQEFRVNARRIAQLVIVLVTLTTLAVAFVAHGFMPGLGWAAAIVLGAIVAPTDEVAVAPIAAKLGVPRHTLAIVQGESLMNDAVSLVIYAVALGAVGRMTLSPVQIGGEFVWSAAGSILAGIVIGRLMIFAWSRIKTPELQIVISLLAPYVAYFLADRLHVSGILAVVTTGLVVARRTPLVIVPQARLFAIGFWETISFVANATIFFLIGFGLHSILDRMRGESWTRLLLEALAVNVTIVVVRFAYIFAQGYVPGMRSTTSAHEKTEPKHLVIIAWAGIRGGVSLAAALALPARFAHRDEFIFLTFSVILVTLVLQGATLPWLISALHIQSDGAERRDVRTASLVAARAALTRLDELEDSGADGSVIGELRRRYERKAARFGRPSDDTTDHEHFARAFASIHTDILEKQSRALLALHDRGKIDNQAMRRVQNAFDLELVRLADLPDPEMGEDED